MTFFLDENFPKAASILLADLGHEVIDIRGSGSEGCADETIFSQAQSAGAVFLTTDRDFFHTIPHLFESHAGVIVVALRQPSRRAILEKLSWALERFEPRSLLNRVIQLRDHTWIAVPPFDTESR